VQWDATGRRNRVAGVFREWIACAKHAVALAPDRLARISRDRANDILADASKGEGAMPPRIAVTAAMPVDNRRTAAAVRTGKLETPERM
jgi:hypothetical protein